MSEKQNGRKRPQNCFRCWHCRRVEGLSSVCVCMVNVTKNVKPEYIEEPYRGFCSSFYDKSIEESKYVDMFEEE